MAFTQTIDELFNMHKASMLELFPKLTESDEFELRRYCSMIVDLDELRERAKGEGINVRIDGKVRSNPIYGVIASMELQANRLAKALGLGAANRDWILLVRKREQQREEARREREYRIEQEQAAKERHRKAMLELRKSQVVKPEATPVVDPFENFDINTIKEPL